MKKLLIALMMLCLPALAQAQQLVTEQPNFYKNITTNTTTVVKSSQGRLYAVVVNNKGSTGTVTLYDNASAASGTKIGTLSLTAEGSINYSVAFANGLTVVTTGTPDITVSFR